jgi:alkylhydroperoxidase family enzyme
MARISLSPRPSLPLRMAKWWMRRAFGQVMDPVLALGHHPKLLRNYMAYQAKVVKWQELDFAPKALAQMAVVAKVGCPWCLDFGYWVCDQHGLSPEKVGKVPAWREHRESFTGVELLAMEYGEAMSETPPAVTDELVASLLERIGEAAFVELTTVVATENARARINLAMGVTSQGFSEACAIPPPARIE